MSETRRDIFKTSVMAVLGASAAAALAACSAGDRSPETGTSWGGTGAWWGGKYPRPLDVPPSAIGATFALLNASDDIWYFFVFKDPSTCALWQSNATADKVPSVPDEEYDTDKWFEYLNSQKMVTQISKTITLNNSGLKTPFPAGLTFSFGKDNNLDLDSLRIYYSVFSGKYYNQLSGSWNEIGHA